MICPHCRKETSDPTEERGGCFMSILFLILLWVFYEGALKIFIARIVTGRWNG